MDAKRFYIFSVNLAIYESDSDRKHFASIVPHIFFLFCQNDELAEFQAIINLLFTKRTGMLPPHTKIQ